MRLCLFVAPVVAVVVALPASSATADDAGRTINLADGAQVIVAPGARVKILRPPRNLARVPRSERRVSDPVRLSARGVAGEAAIVSLPLPRSAERMSVEEASLAYRVRASRTGTRNWRIVPSQVDPSRETISFRLSGRQGSASAAGVPALFSGGPAAFVVTKLNLDRVLQGIMTLGGARAPGQASCTGQPGAPGWLQMLGAENTANSPLRGCLRGDRAGAEVGGVELINNRGYGVILRYGTRVRWGWSDRGFGFPSVMGVVGSLGADGLYIAPRSRASIGVDRSFSGTVRFEARPSRATVALDLLSDLGDIGGSKLVEVIRDSECQGSVIPLLKSDVGFTLGSALDLAKSGLEAGVACAPVLLRRASLSEAARERVERMWRAARTFGRQATAAALALKYGEALIDGAAGGSSFQLVGAPRVVPPRPSPPSPGPSTSPAPAPAPSPARRVITVDNRVTNGMGMREDTTPVRLLTKPWVYCGSRGCNINGTERWSGGTYDAAVCQTFGERTTNGHDTDPGDDANPERFESTRYYGVRLANGTFGVVSEVWVRAADRGGQGLPAC